tara:strand:- start:265 stop:471 length:207 start_codon:yes stop_codon:yes gene_type:complete
MPTKFKSSQTTFVKGQGKVTQNYFIKNTPKQELIDYINKGQKPKIKEKCKRELTRRGIDLVWKAPEND